MKCRGNAGAVIEQRWRPGSVLLECAEHRGVIKGRRKPPDDGIIRVGCERRRGGQLTIIYGLAASELESVANVLKRRCGTGGTAKDGTVSLQGDRRDAALAYFAELGRKAKRMGG